MKIIWHGHSCFEITGKDGTIVFDPYQANSVPGLNPLKLKANLVLCSHEHKIIMQKIVLKQHLKISK